jgi:hypothetical protein
MVGSSNLGFRDGGSCRGDGKSCACATLERDA